ncbi:MAG: DUF3780 domain-containing protein [Blautia sp.]|nr:DUF3780 domain-containing protein [Blautia sp.]
MSAKKRTHGFGVDPDESQNHFYVVIPPKGSQGYIEVYERFEWTPDGLTDEERMAKSGIKEPDKLVVYGEGQIIQKADVLRLYISRHKWGLLSKDLAAEFNARLKEKKMATGKFAVGGTPVERLFGKEMMVLLWGVENCDPSNIPTAIRNWKGLMPEERWWLYTMTNASTGGIKDSKGWRTALRYALCENPIQEDPQISVFDFWDEEDLKK